MEEDDELNSGINEVAKKSLTSFPFSKTTCVCNCGKYNLQDLPLLRKILPEGYEYKLCEYLPLDRQDKFLVTLRMTLATQEEALEWKRRFEEKSLTTHVKDKTFPKVERVSIFKAQYRCQFFDRRKTKKKLPEKSKFRECRSILFINIKKFFKNTVDGHMPAYQTVVRLHYAHDHPLDTADVLKKRQLNEDIRDRFLEMFRQGMKPKDALDKHKKELLQNLGPEKYRQVVCDGYYVPNVPKAYRLYYQIHGKGVSAKTTTKRSSRHNPNSDWIAFQNCPDGIPGESVQDCSDVEEGEDDESADGGEVNNSGEGEMIGQQREVRVCCLGAPDLEDDQKILNQRICARDMALTQNLTTMQSNILGSKPATTEEATHSMIPHDNQQLKLNDINVTYSDLPPQNQLNTGARGYSLPAGSSACGRHHGREMFHIQQTSWENCNLAHQQTMTPNIQPNHNLSFQDLNHYNSSTSFMILHNSEYHNTSNHFVATQENLDQHIQHPLAITHPVSTVVSIAESNSGHQYSLWNQARPHYNVDLTHIYSQPQDTRSDQILLPKPTSNQMSTSRKIPIKKAIKKKKVLKDFNMKHVTKRWMDTKPKVEAETQNLASEVLQTILLADEAEKLKVKLVTFFNDLESKLTSNPKLFVPAVRNFLNAGEKAADNIQLASFFKDFGKTQPSIISDLQTKRNEAMRDHSTQTRLTGPVFKLGNGKLNSQIARTDRCMNTTTSMNQMSHFQVVQNQKPNKINNSSNPDLKSCTVKVHKSEQKNQYNFKKKRNTDEYIQRQVSTDGVISVCSKQVKKPFRQSFREKQTDSACKQMNNAKLKNK